MTTIKPEPLLPCPFGGSYRCEKTPELDYRRGDGYRVRCGCGAVGPRPSTCQDEDAETDEGAALAAWNRRSPQEPSRGEIEAVVWEEAAKMMLTSMPAKVHDECLAKAAAARGGKENANGK